MSVSVSPHETFKLFVTHVERADNLLVVIGQRDRDAAVAVEQAIHLYSPSFKQGNGTRDIHHLSSGYLCCAAYEDTFYRARVISVDAESRGVTVLFIDYGNVEKVPIAAIRSLDGIKGPLSQTPPLATSYVLSRLLSNWTQQKLDAVASQLRYEEVICIPDGTSTVRTLQLVRIMHAGQDYAEYLASHGAGSYIPIQQFEGHLRHGAGPNMSAPAPNPSIPMWQRIVPNQALTATMNGAPGNQMPLQGMPTGAPQQYVNQLAPLAQNGPTVAPAHAMSPSPPVIRGSVPPVISGVPQGMPGAVPTMQTYIRMRPPQPQQPVQYKSSVLEPGSQHRAFISHVEDGPLSFFVQLISTHPLLNSMMQEINSRCPEPLTERMNSGTVCLARYMEDNSLCRALILYKDEKSETCKVYYVDYGNTDNVPASQVFDLPPEFAVQKVSTFLFSLSLKFDEFTIHLPFCFRSLVTGFP